MAVILHVESLPCDEVPASQQRLFRPLDHCAAKADQSNIGILIQQK
jgi:hypothetical protein